MVNRSWTRRLARVVVRPLVGTPVRPNHLTAARLVTGLAACAMFATGLRSWEIAGGVLWVVSAFLDRTDGEFARMSGTATTGGHVFDYASDVLVNSLVFVAIGVGHAAGGPLAPLMGAVAGTSVAAAAILTEHLELRAADGRKAWRGWAGFDFDDILYLLGPVAWLGGLFALLAGAALGGPAFAVWAWLRLRRRPDPGRPGS